MEIIQTDMTKTELIRRFLGRGNKWDHHKDNMIINLIVIDLGFFSEKAYLVNIKWLRDICSFPKMVTRCLNDKIGRN